MDADIRAAVSGPGWKAEVVHVEHTVYAVVYRQEDGHLLRIPFDPREDGTELYTDLKAWTEPAGEALPASARPAVVERLLQALLAFSPKDPWRIWDQVWPRFPLAWVNRPETFLIEHSDTWLQYSEVGRSIVLPCTLIPVQVAGEKPRLQVHPPTSPTWTFPETAGVISPADWKRILQHLGEFDRARIEWV